MFRWFKPIVDANIEQEYKGLKNVCRCRPVARHFHWGFFLKKCGAPSVITKQNPDAAEVGVCIAHIHEGISSIHTLIKMHT